MFKKTTLESGLKVITIPVSGLSTVTILVMVDTGSNNETREINGISHFLEHMFFKGTARRPAAKIISEEVDGMGGYTNAMTSREHTGYYLKAPAHKFDQALDLIADIFSNSLLEQKEVEKERGVILQELRMIQDDPQRYVGFVFESLLYGDQPAGWEIVGTPETLGRMNSENLRKYFSGQYTAEDAFVVVSGNIDENDAVEKVKKYFGSVRRGETTKRMLIADEQNEPAVSVFFKETDQTHFVLGNRAFGANDRRRMAAEVLSHIMGGSGASRLFEEVREKRGMAYAVHTSFDGYTIYGSLSTYAGVEHDNASKAIKIILDEYKKVSSQGVQPGELLRAKESLKGRLAISLESSDALAFYIGGEEVLTGRPLNLEEIFGKIDAVGAEEIQQIAKDVFRQDTLNLALIGPFKDNEYFRDLLKSF